MIAPRRQPGPRYPALIQLLRTVDVIWNQSRLFFDRWALSPTQFNVLNILHPHPQGVTQVELSQALLVHRSNVTGLVDRLEKAGLVARRTDRSDRRVYRIVLTTKGRSLVDEILPHYYAAAEQLLSPLAVERAQPFAEELKLIATGAGAMAAELGASIRIGSKTPG